MSKNSLIVLSLILVAALAIAFSGDRTRNTRPTSERRPSDPLATLPGDPRAGEIVYRQQCVSCHGWNGDGSGPFSDSIFPPRARDHTDGAYMNLRTDHELYDAIMQGGREVSRSRLMPSFKDSFDDLQAWNLVAYIRTLHPRIEDVWPQFAERQYHEVILSEDRRRKIQEQLGRPVPVSARPVYFHSLHDSMGGLSAYILFPIVDYSGLKIPMGLSVGSDLEVARVRTHHRIQGAGADVDRYLAGRREKTSNELLETLRREIELTLFRLKEALDQQKEDQKAEKELLEAFDLRPQTLPRAQRLFLEDCMACHGPRGRPTAFQREYKPRNLADPEHMGRLDNAYLRAVIKHGGIPFNISPSMPSHPRMAPEDLEALAEFVRSLSR